MDLTRIERALREGPVDEPRYVPGAFGPARRFGLLMLTAAVGAALVVGLAIGLGLDLLRAPSPNVGGPASDPAVVQRQLAGTWISAHVSEDDFRSFMLEQGHAQADLDAFLDHDPIETTVQWGLDFDGRGTLVIFSVTGEGVTNVLSTGPYELLPDGRLRWVDLTCVVVAEFSVAADELAFGQLVLENCNADEQLAHHTFFALAPPYTFSAR